MNIFPNDLYMELGYGLTSEEYRCKCDHIHCRSYLISPKLISSYVRLRKMIQRPLKVNSGFRCSEHNYKSNGKPLSRHMTGQAIDISLHNLRDFSKEEIKGKATAAGFTFILFYENFIHLDVR